jgi:hypothetical protein
MGFMDKVKAQATVLADKAQTGVQQGQTKLAELQTGKQEDHLLRELGAYVFLSERGRLQPDSEAKVAGLMGQLDALEAAGSPVTITPEPSVAPAPGTAPAPGGVPPTAAPVPPPVPDPAPQAAPPPSPSPPPAPPAAGGAVPQSSNRLPGQ